MNEATGIALHEDAVRWMKLRELFESIPGIRCVRLGCEEVGGLAYHSRTVQKGDLFIAVRGFQADGHDFLEEALRNGACALLVEDLEKVPAPLPGEISIIQATNTRQAMALVADAFYRHPSGKLRLVGVTGTNGKTTTAYLVESIFRLAGRMTGLVGTVTYRIGTQELPVGRTTPESVDLQKMLAEMVGQGVEMAAMEVSSHALDLHRADGCEFAVSVFTNLSQDHLDYHRDMENYFAAKRKLFTGYGNISTKKAAINIDDSYGKRLLEELQGEAFTYGTSPEARLRGELLQLHLQSSSVRVAYEGKESEFDAPLVGHFNLYNIMAAISVALLLGLSLEEAVEGVMGFPGVPGRFQAVDGGQDFAVIVDYAHTPDSLAKAIQAAKGIARGRVITVFGCGGDRDRGKRPLMGRYSGELSDYTVITSDNPRSEDPREIIGEIEAGIREVAGAERYEIVVDRRAGIKRAIELASSGDVVLIAGKGHERGQIFADRVVPFEDYQVARELLRSRGG